MKKFSLAYTATHTSWSILFGSPSIQYLEQMISPKLYGCVQWREVTTSKYFVKAFRFFSYLHLSLRVLHFLTSFTFYSFYFNTIICTWVKNSLELGGVCKNANCAKHPCEISDWCTRRWTNSATLRWWFLTNTTCNINNSYPSTSVFPFNHFQIPFTFVFFSPIQKPCLTSGSSFPNKWVTVAFWQRGNINRFILPPQKKLS